MPFKSQAQRKFMYSQHPELAEEFESATPKDAKLPKKLHPEKTVKRSYDEGFEAALERFGVKQAAEEVRLKIPRREFHGWDEAWKKSKRGEKRSAAQPLEPQADPSSPVEQLVAMLQQMPDPKGSQRPDATKDPLDRETLWSGPSHLGAGDAAGRVSDMGQNTGGGPVF